MGVINNFGIILITLLLGYNAHGVDVFMVPPTNETRLEGENVQINCKVGALPDNVLVKWFHEGVPVGEVTSLGSRITIQQNGSLIINPVSADDSGQYLCEARNGTGEPYSASAYLNIEYPAKVIITPTIQYLPFGLTGVVQCNTKANPPIQFITWTKDKRLLEPDQTNNIVVMNNGSLLFTKVNPNHQGHYTCTPYNSQGTQGSSGPIEVLVRKPPNFTVKPETVYQRQVGETVEMHCNAQEAEGTQRPTIVWQRRDETQLQEDLVRISGGNLTIEGLRRSDFGIYQCIVSNEVTTIATETQLVEKGSPYNFTANASETSVTLSWLPGYSEGSDYKQNYTIWYREAGVSEWFTIPVTPLESTQVTINRLVPGMTYEFQVVGENDLGIGMMSYVITVQTLDDGLMKKVQENSTVLSFPSDDTDTKPSPPRNLSGTKTSNGTLISWQPPLEHSNLVQYYTIKYKIDGAYRNLNKDQINPDETSYLVKNLVGGKTYYFRVLAVTGKSYESSDELKYVVPAQEG